MSSIQERRIKNWNVEEKISFTFQKKTFFCCYISVNTFRIKFLTFLITCFIRTNAVDSDASSLVES